MCINLSMIFEVRTFKHNAFNEHIILRSPVNTEEVDDYLEYVKNPMDFEKMHQKLDDGEYSCAQVNRLRGCVL